MLERAVYHPSSASEVKREVIVKVTFCKEVPHLFSSDIHFIFDEFTN